MVIELTNRKPFGLDLLLGKKKSRYRLTHLQEQEARIIPTIKLRSYYMGVILLVKLRKPNVHIQRK